MSDKAKARKALALSGTSKQEVEERFIHMLDSEI